VEIISVVSIIVSLILVYFFFGVFIKFLWGWFPLVVGGIVSLALEFSGGVISPIIAIIIFILSLNYTNNWQGSDLYFKIEEKIDSLFYFRD